MRDSKDLYVVGEVIKDLMTKDERCRNDDGYLYYRVLEHRASTLGQTEANNFRWFSLQDFLMNKHGRNYPCFETVRRSRTKIQEQNPHLRSNRVVSEFRAANETEFKQWNAVYGV